VMLNSSLPGLYPFYLPSYHCPTFKLSLHFKQKRGHWQWLWSYVWICGCLFESPCLSLIRSWWRTKEDSFHRRCFQGRLTLMRWINNKPNSPYR
jgi:hypothetical protein